MGERVHFIDQETFEVFNRMFTMLHNSVHNEGAIELMRKQAQLIKHQLEENAIEITTLVEAL
jgi:hypothetical protein